MSGDKPERVECVLDFSSKEKAGRGRPRPGLEDRSSSFLSLTSCQFNKDY